MIKIINKPELLAPAGDFEKLKNIPKKYMLILQKRYGGQEAVEFLETGDVDEQYFISLDKLYYTNPSVTHSDETNGKLNIIIDVTNNLTEEDDVDLYLPFPVPDSPNVK